MRKWTLGLMLMMLAGAATGNTPEKVVLDAANMTCPACSITIEKALEKVPGVTGTQVDTKAATVTVTFDSELTSIPAVARAINDAGFPAKARASGDLPEDPHPPEMPGVQTSGQRDDSHGRLQVYLTVPRLRRLGGPQTRRKLR